ncbi:LiaI-LiaF-like domain-containing protein [Virgibacillus kimchii]
MKKQQSIGAYILIGIGVFFLLRQLKVPILTNFYSWQTIVIIIGLAFLIHSYKTKSYQNIFSGIVLLGIGIHFHGLEHYTFWIDHWAVYILIIGMAFLIRSTKTKDSFLIGILLSGLAVLLLFPFNLPDWLSWIYIVFELVERYWAIILIIIGIYLLRRGK